MGIEARVGVSIILAFISFMTGVWVSTRLDEHKREDDSRDLRVEEELIKIRELNLAVGVNMQTVSVMLRQHSNQIKQLEQDLRKAWQDGYDAGKNSL